MGQLYLIQVIGAVGGGQPDNSLPPMIGGGPIYPPYYPDQGLPGGGGSPPGIWPNPPDNSTPPPRPQPRPPGQPGHLPSYPPGIWPTPPGGRPDQGLPGQPPYPSQGLPPGIWGGAPLPGGGPQPLPAYTQDQVGSPPASVDDGKGQWVLVTIPGQATCWAWTQPPGSAEVEPPTGGGERPDQGLPPGSPGAPDQGLPPQPPTAGQLPSGGGTTPPPSTKPNPVPTPQRR